MQDRALVGAAAAVRGLDRDAQRAVAQATTRTLRPLWQKTVATRLRYAQRAASPRQDKRMVGRGSVSVSMAGRGTLRAYTGTRPLTGGMTPAGQWAFVEFGSTKAHARRGQLPGRTPTGRIVYPAVRAWAPTAASVWLGVLYDEVRRAFGTGR